MEMSVALPYVLGWITLGVAICMALWYEVKYIANLVVVRTFGNWDGAGLDKLRQTVKLLELEVSQKQNKIEYKTVTTKHVVDGSNVSVWQYTDPLAPEMLVRLNEDGSITKAKVKAGSYNHNKKGRKKRHGKSNTKVQPRRPRGSSRV